MSCLSFHLSLFQTQGVLGLEPHTEEEIQEEEVSEENSAENLEEEIEKILAEAFKDKNSNSLNSDPRVEGQKRPSLNQLVNQRQNSNRRIYPYQNWRKYLPYMGTTKRGTTQIALYQDL